MLYFAPLLLYFPQFIPGYETQPLFALTLGAWGLWQSRNGNAQRAAMASLWALSFVILLQLLLGVAPPDALAALQLAAGPFLLISAAALDAKPPSRSQLNAVTLYLTILAIMELAFPVSYGQLSALLLERAPVSDGHRGISLLTPEPTYAAITAIYFLLLTTWSRISTQPGRRRWWPAEWVLLLLLALTLSTYAILLLLVLAFSYRPKLTLAAVGICLSILTLVTTVALGNEDSVRAIVAISRILAADRSDFLFSLSLVDPSLGSRIISLVAAFGAPLQHPIGLGLGCGALPIAISTSPDTAALENIVLSDVMASGCLKPNSYLAATTSALGLLAIPYLLAVVLAIRRSYSRLDPWRLWLPPLLTASAVLAIQGQITNPIAWLLLHFCCRVRHQIGNRAAATIGGAPAKLPAFT